MKDIKKLNEDFKDVFRRGVEKVVPKVGKTGYNPAGEGNFGGGFFMSNAPKEDLEKLHFIGYVKFLQDEMNKGHSPVGRVGRVTDDDLKRYDDYKAWYDEYMADMEDDELEDDELDMDESLSSLSAKLKEALNEISDDLADKVSKKRNEKMAKAFVKNLIKPTAGTKKKLDNADAKWNRNNILNVSRDQRRGVVNTEQGRMSQDKYYALDPDKRPRPAQPADYAKQLDKEYDNYKKKHEE